MQIFKNFEPRLYQETIYASASTGNTLVVLPTGLGKTAISMMLAASRIKKDPESKVVILAPTKPLVHQHLDSFKEMLDMQFIHPDEMVVFTGNIRPEERQELWKDAKVIFSTPQGLENDILSSKITLDDVSLFVFDEAHRATGDYSYNWIAKQYMKQSKKPLIMALTASPGSNQDVIKEVCDNLFIENIEVRDKDAQDVAPYVKETKTNYREVDLPPVFQEILKPLYEMMTNRVKSIRNLLGQVNPRVYNNPKYVSKKDLLVLNGKIQGMLKRQSDPSLYSAMSTSAQIIKLQHAIELLETQGVNPCRQYLDGIWKDGKKSKSKAVQNIMNDKLFKVVMDKIWTLDGEEVLHPKLFELENIVLEYLHKKPDAKIIVFNNYRDSIVNLKALFDKAELKSRIFVGQAKKKGLGLSQKEQLQLIKDFREDKFNIMIMSSVGEEGLDIPAVDLVVFYEPVPSAIRQIQRAGRTGRQEKGEVTVLVARNTRDVGYLWATKHKQKRMYETLEKFKKTMTFEGFGQTTLADVEAKQTIIVDQREKANRIVKDFVDQGYKIDLKQLQVGDYILTNDVGVEFKTKKDFVDSIVDGRLFEQAGNLARTFNKPLIVVQGDEDIYSMRNISAQAIIGAMSSIATSFRIPILFTKDDKETFDLFKSIVKRQGEKLEYSPHSLKPKSLEDQQEYLVSSLPGVGIGMAKALLKEFQTVERIMNASVEDLSKVERMGKITAEKIRNVLSASYPK